jgi:hypothetical protein
VFQFLSFISFRIINSIHTKKTVVLENGYFLHVGPPVIRLLPVTTLLNQKRRPIVYRPSMSDTERRTFLLSLKELVGRPYATLFLCTFSGSAFCFCSRCCFAVVNVLAVVKGERCTTVATLFVVANLLLM